MELTAFEIAAFVGTACAIGVGKLLAKGLKERFAYRDYLWEPLFSIDLDGRTLDHFEKQTAALVPYGFRPVGDFLLSKTPHCQIIRVLVGSDRRLFANIGCCGGTLDVAFQSVLSSGIGFETSTYDLSGSPPPDVGLDRLVFQSVQGEASDVLAAHLAALDDYAAAGDDSLEFAPEDFRKPADYLHRLVHYSLHRQGFVPPMPITLARVPEYRPA